MEHNGLIRARAAGNDTVPGQSDTGHGAANLFGSLEDVNVDRIAQA